MLKCGASRSPYGDERYYLSDDEVREIWQMMLAAVPADDGVRSGAERTGEPK